MVVVVVVVAEEVENRDGDSTEMTVAVVGVVMAVVAVVVKEGGSLVTACGVGLKCRPCIVGEKNPPYPPYLHLPKTLHLASSLSQLPSMLDTEDFPFPQSIRHRGSCPRQTEEPDKMTLISW